MNEICKAHATHLRCAPERLATVSRARVRACGTPRPDTSLRNAAIAVGLRVLRSDRRRRPRERRGLAFSARARALHLLSPRPAEPDQNTAERSSNDLSRGPKKRRTLRNIAAFGATQSYQTAPLCQAKRSGSSARKLPDPRHSRDRHARAAATGRARAGNASARRGAERSTPRCDTCAVAHPLPPGDAMLRRSCRNFDAGVGDPPGFREMRRPAELCGTALRRESTALFWEIPTPPTRSFKGTCRSPEAARSAGRRASARSGRARRRDRRWCECG